MRLVEFDEKGKVVPVTDWQPISDTFKKVQVYQFKHFPK